MRESGILMHISSLYGDYSIGNFGKSAFEFIDFIKDCGFSVWQVLPFTVTDEYNSPYKSFSAFGGNPYFIDLETLCEDGLLTKSQIESFKWGENYILLKPTKKYGISHGDMIDLNRENIEDFDVREFYVGLVEELKRRGL